MNARLKQYTDKEYEDKLNDENKKINILGLIVGAGTALKEIDPIAFYEMKDNGPEEWECKECGTIYGSEEEAEECC